MSDYKFEVGREYRTRGGLPCVVIANDPAVGLVWRVLLTGGGWTLMSSDICKPESQFHPVPPERTVYQWQWFNEGTDSLQAVGGLRSCDHSGRVLCRWTIGIDGKPAYAVRLDDSGEPMYRVEPVAKWASDD